MSSTCLALLLVSLSSVPGDDEVVARAGDIVVTREAFADWLVERVGWAHAPECLSEMLILAAAEDAGRSPTDAQITDAATRQRTEVIDRYFRGVEQDYLDDLRRKGLDPDRHEERRRADVRILLCLEALAAAERTIDEAALRTRYRDLYGDLGERLSLEVLFFSAYHGLQPGDERPPLTELQAAATARAQAAADGLRAGRALDQLFPDSDPCPSEFVVGGRVDQYRTRMLGVEVERALQSLDEPGDVTPVVAVWDGAYVLRLVGRTSVSFEEARPELERLLAGAPPSSDEISAARNRVLQAVEMEVFLR